LKLVSTSLAFYITVAHGLFKQTHNTTNLDITGENFVNLRQLQSKNKEQKSNFY
jgi:hypothetical protein